MFVPLRRIGFSCLVLVVAVVGMMHGAAAQSPPANAGMGEYTMRAADCMACHTRQGGTPFAGGREVGTPFGTISSPNITPDADTGIGRWTDDQFVVARAMGSRPAFYSSAERVLISAPLPAPVADQVNAAAAAEHISPGQWIARLVTKALAK